MELTKAHLKALDEAQLAMLHVLHKRYPREAMALCCTCVARAFADLVSSSEPAGVAQLFEVINAQLAHAGAEVRLLPRN